VNSAIRMMIGIGTPSSHNSIERMIGTPVSLVDAAPSQAPAVLRFSTCSYAWTLSRNRPPIVAAKVAENAPTSSAMNIQSDV